ncbi:MAG TPA: hypothetical protein V6C95_03560, partial [Coleofasciculaceae cyanobacterium]
IHNPVVKNHVFLICHLRIPNGVIKVGKLEGLNVGKLEGLNVGKLEGLNVGKLTANLLTC